jgi:DNA-directed RNA polymerase specialized sigma24 family protein
MLEKRGARTFAHVYLKLLVGREVLITGLDGSIMRSRKTYRRGDARIKPAICVEISEASHWWRMEQDQTGETEFRELINRLRAGEEDAASELIDRFGDFVRREIRFRLRDSRLFRVVGESDLFQSAVSRFLWGLKLGQFDLDRPEELVSLLRTIAERRVCAVARFWQAQRRDVRRHADLGSALGTELTSADPTPSKAMSEKELVAETLTRLPEDARQVLDWRQDGLSWAQIAHLRGPTASPDAERKRYERALDRVAAELGWSET